MPKRVLIVDDALFMRNTLRDIFAGAGFQVAGEADDGVQAVNLFRELKPDLVTMDIVMPYKSGIDPTREIVQLDPNAVVGMCSALGQESLVMEAIQAGRTGFILKALPREDGLAPGNEDLPALAGAGGPLPRRRSSRRSWPAP